MIAALMVSCSSSDDTGQDQEEQTTTNTTTDTTQDGAGSNPIGDAEVTVQAFLDESATGNIDEATEEYCEDGDVVPPEFISHMEQAVEVNAMYGTFDENNEDVVVWCSVEISEPRDIINYNITVSSDGKITDISLVER
jgi:hypothetical protein